MLQYKPRQERQVMGSFELIMQKRMLVAMMCSCTNKGCDFHAMVWQSYSELISAFVHFTYIRDTPVHIFWLSHPQYTSLSCIQLYNHEMIFQHFTCVGGYKISLKYPRRTLAKFRKYETLVGGSRFAYRFSQLNAIVTSKLRTSSMLSCYASRKP